MQTGRLLFLPSGILALCLLLAAPLGLGANKVYKWVDDDGVTHYGTRAPTGHDASSFTPRTGHSEPVNYSGENEAAKTESGSTAQLESQRIARPDPERCQAAQNNLKALSNFGRVKIETDDGSFRYLEREEMEERTKEARQVIAEAC